MHFGVPILCANAASLPEVAGDAAEFTDPHDPTAIARSLQRISGDVGLRTELVRRGRQQLARFSLSAEAARLAHFFEAAGRHQAP
jgi:glycosyltransferase involved in cell wall biosynthesis